MDLNQLLMQHQVALMNARHSPPGQHRDAYWKIASHYAHRLEEFRRSRHLHPYGDSHNDQNTAAGESPLENLSKSKEFDMPSLADTRRHGTSEERKVLALEMIADQLLLIHADLLAMNEISTPVDMDGSGAMYADSEIDVDNWDNEGGNQSRSSTGAGIPGIVKKMVETYSVGPYTYTDLAMALAELDRTRPH